MGLTFSQFQNKLLGELDVLPPSSLASIINDALQDIYDANDWGFLFREDYIRTPAQILGDCVVANQFDTTLVLSIATRDALVAATTNINNPKVTERQLRVLDQVQQDRGFVYNIVDFDAGAGTLTIDKPFQEAAGFHKIQIIKIYYYPPLFNRGTAQNPDLVVDFKRFEFAISPQYNRRINLNVTKHELNRADPLRIYQSDPWCFVPYTADDAGVQRFELYPSPLFDRVIRVLYLRRGTLFLKGTDTAPNIFSNELILSRARIKAYEWAMANSDKLNVNPKAPAKYQNLIALLNSPNNPSSYPNLLDKAIKMDEELHPKAFIADFSELPEFDYELGGRVFGETYVLDF